MTYHAPKSNNKRQGHLGRPVKFLFQKAGSAQAKAHPCRRRDGRGAECAAREIFDHENWYSELDRRRRRRRKGREGRKSNGRLTSTSPKGLSPFQNSSHFRRTKWQKSRIFRNLVFYMAHLLNKAFYAWVIIEDGICHIRFHSRFPGTCEFKSPRRCHDVN